MYTIVEIEFDLGQRENDFIIYIHDIGVTCFFTYSIFK